MLLRPESERVHVDAGVGGAGVGEEGLNEIEVGSLALREAILAVELELGGDDWVLAPTVEGESGLREDEGAGIADERLLGVAGRLGKVVLVGTSGSDTRVSSVSGVYPPVIIGGVNGVDEGGRGARGLPGEINVGPTIKSGSVGEETVDIDKVVVGRSTDTLGASNRVGTTKGMDGVGGEHRRHRCS